MKSRKTGFEKLAVLLLTGIFAVSLLLVLLTGVKTYRRLTEHGRESYDRRTVAQYITTKIRQSDSEGSVSVEPFGEGSALVLRENINGISYLTRIYAYDGYLMELLSSETAEMSPSDGTKIIGLCNIDFSCENGIVTAVYTEGDGGEAKVTAMIRSEEGAGK